MGTVYQTQSQGYENTTYQAMGTLLLLPRHLGVEASLPPLTPQSLVSWRIKKDEIHG